MSILLAGVAARQSLLGFAPAAPAGIAAIVLATVFIYSLGRLRKSTKTAKQPK